MISTHAAVGIKLSRNAMRKERMYARTLPALKHANERKIKEGAKDENDKKRSITKRKRRKEETACDYGPSI